MKTNKIILVLFAVAVIFSTPMVSAREPVKIRVAVLKEVQEVTVSVSGNFVILDAKSNNVLDHARNLSASKVVATPEGLKIKGMNFKADAVMISSKRKAAIIVNGRPYRGDISIFKDSQGQLLVVNTLDLEFYLKGVLYHEVSPKWPIDAIKAQAVAARTYAMYQKEVMKSKDYDLTADTSSQVYGGYGSEKHKTNRAVNFTEGEILTYQGKVFPAYFHATCGGITEDASELWKIDLAPLKGGRVCSFCRDSPHYYWNAALDLRTIQKKLGSDYKIKGDLKNISITERDATARVRTLELKDAEGNCFTILAKDFRALVGADLVRSTNFSIVLDQDHVLFNGKGWGHGVGLCQWGAFGMSQKGYDYKQILAFYYPGAELTKI